MDKQPIDTVPLKDSYQLRIKPTTWRMLKEIHLVTGMPLIEAADRAVAAMHSETKPQRKRTRRTAAA